MIEFLDGEIEKQESDSNIQFLEKGSITKRGERLKHDPGRVAKETVTELVSQIPYDKILDDVYDRHPNKTFKRMNCGLDCKHFRPEGEILDEKELLVEEDGKVVKKKRKIRRNGHECKGRTTDKMRDNDCKRCTYKEVYEKVKIVPDWIDELVEWITEHHESEDEENNSVIPKTERQLRDDGKLSPKRIEGSDVDANFGK